MNAEWLLQQALEYHQSGDLTRARDLYQQILTYEPEHPRALHFLGVLCHQTARHDEGARWLEQSLAVEPDDLAAWNNLGLIRQAQGRWAEALACYEEALARDARYAVGLNNRGNVLVQLRQLDEAIDSYRAAVTCRPNYVDAWANLANGLRRQGHSAESIRCCERALALDPNCAAAHNQLGLLARQIHDWETALRHFERAWILRPDLPEIGANRGVTLADYGQWHLALDALEELDARHPHRADVQRHLGHTLRLMGSLDEAIRRLQQALELDATNLETRVHLGLALREAGRYDEALRCFRDAALETPEDVTILNNLANVLRDQGEWAGALEILNVALRFAAHHIPALMNRAALFERMRRPLDALNDLQQVARRLGSPERTDTSVPQSVIDLRMACVDPGILADREAIDQQRARTDECLQRHAGSLDLQAPTANSWLRYAPSPPLAWLYQDDSNREMKEHFAAMVRPYPKPLAIPSVHTSSARPRLGFFVSPRHEGTFLRCTAGLVARLDPEQWDLRVIGTTSTIAQLARTLSPEQVTFTRVPQHIPSMAVRMREEACDWIYYWEVGTDATNYYVPFYRPAPCQVTSWGVLDTSGHPAIDHYYSSALVEPGDAGEYYRESLVLAKTLLTYQRRLPAPWVPTGYREQLGFDATDHVYLCAQNLAKVHSDFDTLVAGILARDPRACVAFFADRQKVLATQLQQRFARTIPGAERIRWLPHQPYDDYRATLTVADVLLDTVHCGGGLTAYDALALGKPIVTWPGRFARGRYVQACYRKMGWCEGVVNSAEEYIERAVAWGSDADCRTMVEQQIASRAEVLFEDSEAVVEFAQIVERHLTNLLPDPCNRYPRTL